MSWLLFELGVEDLPALAIDQACDFMRSFLADNLKELRLTHGKIEVLGTPRRLVVMIDDLLEKQPDFTEEVLGPSVNVAFDAQGSLSKAGLGFIKSKGLDEKNIYKKAGDKGEVIAGQRVEVGKTSEAVLPELLIDMLRKIPFKKRMRWNNSGETFSRPIAWILALIDGKILPLSFAGVSSGDESRGHRFMSPEIFKVSSSEQYLAQMKERFVILSADEREKMFVHSAEEKLKSINTNFVYDADLMAVVRNIVEYPFVILGKFSEKYLKIPAEILVCEMKAHQKCFAVFDQNGAIMPYFVCSSGTRPYDEQVFAKGNERVLRARFEDGAFYYELDSQKTLAEHGKLLSTLIFERELGTVHDKSVRVEKLAMLLAEKFGVSKPDLDLIKESAPLLKADLTSGVVGQFPELQGVMGRIYAKNDGLSAEVSETIETHYWPRFAEDKLPRLKASAILSMADRIDTILGIIAIGKKPSGNKDPFALRRAAIGIVRMILGFGFSIDVKDMFHMASAGYKMDCQKAITEAEEFLLQRARGVLIEELAQSSKEYAVNFADSAFAAGSKDILDIFARAQTLSDMRQKSSEFQTLVQTFKRASNIVKKNPGNILTLNDELRTYLALPVEKDLLKAVDDAAKLLDIKTKKESFESLCENYSEKLKTISAIKPKLDAFFDNVMVMAEDEKLKAARLAMLSDIKQIADKIGDFTHL